ncbi:MAG: DUF3999 family protein [Sphingobacteriaceae bacterium]|nr:DUF3999 family protein [Sphingobacteriaceae bacterium]
MKNIPKFNKLFLPFSLVASIFSSAWAQDKFVYKADLEKITQPGFYKVYLDPELVAKSQVDLSDLRIMDKKKNFVPYIRLQSLPSVKEDFLDFPILQTSENTDSITSIIIENRRGLLIRSLWLKLKNTAVSRKADVLGSDDRQRWFAIDEEVPLAQATAGNADSYLQSLSFPASNYKYFKVNVNNKQKSPLKILSAGIFSTETEDATFSLLPSPSVSRKDSSDKISYLQFRFKEKFQVNKLFVSIISPRYFRRTVMVFEVEGKERLLLSETVITSESRPEIVVSSKAQNFELQILNGDNPALEIASIQAWQLNEYILAYLEPSQNYQLLVGDKHALQPDYDLKFFGDSALRSASGIKHLGLEKNPLLKLAITKKSADYTLWLWVAIVLVLGLLSFSTWRMMGALKEKG